MAERRPSSTRADRKDRPRRPENRHRTDRPQRSPRPARESAPVLDHTLDAPAFGALGLPHPLTMTLANLGIDEPFPIQAATIPDALAGHDVLGRGRTGSGKTLAFGLPMLTRLMGEKSQPHHPRALILVPTRELAMQVREALTPLAQQVRLHLQLVIGGASYQRQMEGLARGADVVVATPGRLIDLVERRACDLSDVSIAVLDEADQMCDMGFFDEVEQLMQLVQPGGQRLLFSATLDKDVQRLVDEHLQNPVEHATDPETASVSTMTHHLLVVDAREKPEIVHSIAKRQGRTICFARTQLGVEQWARELEEQGVRVDALHGGKSQAARAKAVENLKAGKVDVLVATDVAARGIHIDDIDMVLQIDPPRDPKDYLHRSGRTARAGKEGMVVLIATTRQIRSVEKLLATAGVDAIDKRVRAGDAYLAEVTGARDEVAPRRRPAHLREEQAVRRALVQYDDDLSDIEHNEARPRTAPVDDRRWRPRSNERAGHEARRVERRAERPRDDRRERPIHREDRYERPAFRDDRRERSAFRDRDDRRERPAFRDDRRERPAARDDRRERPAFRDRDERPSRPAFRDDRRERPAFRDRDDRRERPASRDERPSRPASRDERRERPAAPRQNRKRTDKPRWTSADRKSRKGRGK